jgi:hypothetical protein
VNYFVTQLKLGFNNLRGSIPGTIEKMKNLRVLKLDGNQLTGQIPNELYNLAELQVLDLSRNMIQGPLSESVIWLSQLRRLVLYGNKLSGSIPFNLGNLVNLDTVLLHQNNFNGALPPTLTALTNVTTWDLTSNNLVNGTFLPQPLCPACVRTKVKSDFANCTSQTVGHLLSCSSSRVGPVRRAVGNFWFGNLTEVEGMWEILLDLPELCVYRYS